MEFKKRKPKKQFMGDTLSTPSQRHWYEEDQEWRSLAQKVKQQAAEDIERNKNEDKPPVFVEDDTEKVEVNIKISVPKIDIAKQKARLKPLAAHLSRIKDKAVQTTTIQRGAALAVVVLLVAAIPIYKTINKPNEAKEVKGATTSEQDPNKEFSVSDKPLFDTVLPKGRKIEQDQISFDAKRNFAKYTDDINGTKINVSEQPLPEQFKNDPEGSVQNMAKNFSATEKLTSNGQTMYYGESAKGFQTIILTKKSVLVFISTTAQVEKESLKVYASNLD